MYSVDSTSQFYRSFNVGRNIVYGLINRFISLLLPFIVRTVMIYRFGTLYLGMNSLLASVFQMLNLAELGFSTAVVYSLYRPVAEGDTKTICAYLGTYRQIYRFIGLIIMAAGLLFLPYFPNLLKNTEIPGNINLYVWYLIFLADTVISYLLFGYKTVIPSALQRNDLLSKINTIILICKSMVQICCLLLTEIFYFYLITSLVFTVLRNILISHLVRLHYPQYICRGNITTEQFDKLKLLVLGLALSKFRGASRHMIDSACITVFVGLTATAIYSNYFLIHSAVVSLSAILCSAMQSSVGNSIVKDSRNKAYKDMRRFNFMYMLFAGWAVICLLCLYQPFVKLWLGESLMLGFPEVVALCLYFYVLKMGDMRWVYHQGAGLWWKARYFVVAEILCNIILNILLAKYWGVLGIILATLFSLLFINFGGGALILFKEYFQNGKLKEFFTDQALYFAVTAGLAMICLCSCNVFFNDNLGRFNMIENGNSLIMTATSVTEKISSIIGLIGRALLCTIVTLIGYFTVYHRTARYKDAKGWLSNRYITIRNMI